MVPRGDPDGEGQAGPGLPLHRQCPFQLPRVIILIESYDELSAAADRGVGELRLMTLGNQGSS